MKVYISADIEGVSGVTHWDEADPQKEDYRAAREQMTAEVAAACEGALQAGATEIWVKDAHDGARNIIAAKLPKEVRLIRGWTGHPLAMVQELDKTFAAVMMVGYHSRAGAGTNPLAHTLTGKIAWITLNGRYASEFLLHAYAAAWLEIPVALVTGDKGLCAEVSQLNPRIATVAVKEGIGGATLNIHPELATQRIRQAAQEALAGDLAQFRIALPPHFVIVVSYRQPSQARTCGFYPGAQQKDDTTIQFASDDYFEVLRFLHFVA